MSYDDDENLMELFDIFGKCMELLIAHSLLPNERGPLHRRMRPKFWEKTNYLRDEEF